MRRLSTSTHSTPLVITTSYYSIVFGTRHCSFSSTLTTSNVRSCSSISTTRNNRNSILTKSSATVANNSTNAKRNDTTTTTTSSNWREWFRSSDYDDPWSDYYPFQNNLNEAASATTTTNTTTAIIARHRETYQKTIVPSVLLLRGLRVEEENDEDETPILPLWQRRRHGMNLEPITMHPAPMQCGGATKVEGAESIDEEAAATHLLYEKAEAKCRRLDNQTRFLCRMLDDLYRTGIWRESDRPTVERCHRVSYTSCGVFLRLFPISHSLHTHSLSLDHWPVIDNDTGRSSSTRAYQCITTIIHRLGPTSRGHLTADGIVHSSP